MLSRWTVFACYCIYASKTKREYRDRFLKLVDFYQTKNDDIKQIGEDAKLALALMRLPWEKTTKEKIDLVNNEIKNYRKKHNEIMDDYRKYNDTGFSNDVRDHNLNAQRLKVMKSHLARAEVERNSLIQELKDEFYDVKQQYEKATQKRDKPSIHRLKEKMDKKIKELKDLGEQV